LIALTGLNDINNLAQLKNDATIQNAIVLNFPSMPDSVELVRKAVYSTHSLYVSPDGALAWYQYTEPLRIPFSFRLHAFDVDYCPQGALTLLDVAAKLHSMVLPIGERGASTIAVKIEEPKVSTSEQSVSLGADDQANGHFDVKRDAAALNVRPPVSVFLDLIYVGSDAPGISCVGYLEEVSVKLNGPWLTPPGSGNKNLPTSIDASFTFVHRPSHTNAKQSAEVAVSAFADDVKDRLYNTLHLVNAKSYQGYLDGRSFPSQPSQPSQPSSPEEPPKNDRDRLYRPILGTPWAPNY
jgi:hypothetical protein